MNNPLDRATRALFVARFRQLLRYRVAAWCGAFVQLFWGIMLLQIYGGFYRATDRPAPMPWDQLISYVWLGQAIFMLVPWTIDGEIRTMIDRGHVAYELVRPVGLYRLWFARGLAQRTAPVMLRGLPVLLVSGAWFGLRPPPDWVTALWCLPVFFMALWLSVALTVLVHLTLLWTVSGEGVAIALASLAYVASGHAVPLVFLPDGLRIVLQALPFAGIVDGPLRLWIGHHPVENAWTIAVHQGLWIAILTLAGRHLARRSTQHLSVQGG